MDTAETNLSTTVTPLDVEGWKTLIALWGPINTPTRYSQAIYNLAVLTGIQDASDSNEENLISRVNRGDQRITLFTKGRENLVLKKVLEDGTYKLAPHLEEPKSDALHLALGVLNRSLPDHLRQLLYYGE